MQGRERGFVHVLPTRSLPRYFVVFELRYIVSNKQRRAYLMLWKMELTIDWSITRKRINSLVVYVWDWWGSSYVSFSYDFWSNQIVGFN